MKFVSLVKTGEKTGLVPADQLRMLVSDVQSRAKIESETATNEVYTLAARITGEVKAADDAAKPDAAKADADKAGKDAAAGKSTAAEEAAKKRAARQAHPLDVVLVMDIDMMESNVFALCARSDEEDELGVHFDNIVFVLNTLDVLAGDTRFVEIRKRKPAHRTLTTIDDARNENRDRITKVKKDFNDKYNAELQKARAEGEAKANEFRQLQQKIAKLQQQGDDIPTELQMQYVDAVLGKAVEDKRLKDREDQIDARTSPRVGRRRSRLQHRHPPRAELLQDSGRGAAADSAVHRGDLRLFQPPLARTRRRFQVAPAVVSPPANK